MVIYMFWKTIFFSEWIEIGVDGFKQLFYFIWMCFLYIYLSGFLILAVNSLRIRMIKTFLEKKTEAKGGPEQYLGK